MQKFKEQMGNRQIHDWCGKKEPHKTLLLPISTKKKRRVESRHGEIKRENGELANP
ncbi:hypothetical protein AMTRI_Chr01g104250 [Amborella trichopoda]